MNDKVRVTREIGPLNNLGGRESISIQVLADTPHEREEGTFPVVTLETGALQRFVSELLHTAKAQKQFGFSTTVIFDTPEKTGVLGIGVEINPQREEF